MAQTIEKSQALIIGVDFGTTYSGVAWCMTNDPTQIKVVDAWPGGAAENRASGQVPTVIAYSAKDVNKHRWGFGTTMTTSNRLAWFKLLLNQRVETRDTIARIDSGKRKSLMTRQMLAHLKSEQELEARLRETRNLIPKEKDVVDVVADYLRELVKCTDEALERTYPKSLLNQIGSQIPVQYMLTVPAVWSDRAKALTLQAAKMAGMIGPNGKKRDVRLISEPEAAAMHCLRFYQDTQNCLEVGEIYVVADCGGGTVDLISYEITAISPRLKVKECVAGTGGMCGSTSLNRRFMNFLKERLGPKQFDALDARMKTQLESDFDNIKKNFKPMDVNEDEDDDDDDDFDDDNLIVFRLPTDIRDNPAKGIERGRLVLTQKDMIAIFLPTFAQITALVLEQVESAQTRSGHDVTGILLVGGFGESQYLRDHLQQQLARKFTQKIIVLQPVNAWSAIVRGAVHDGIALQTTGSLSNGMLESRRARFSYGTEICRPFLHGVHPIENRFYHSHRGGFWCRGLMDWFIKKNEELSCDSPLKSSLQWTFDAAPQDYEFKSTETIYVCDSENPPILQKNEGVIKLLEYTADFVGQKHCLRIGENKDTEEEFKYLMFERVLQYDSAKLIFSVEMNGKQIAVGQKVEYQHINPASANRNGLMTVEQYLTDLSI